MLGIAILLVLGASGNAVAADPLPQGATLRLGETRFRARGEIGHLRFSADGSVLLGWVLGVDEQLQPVAWDATTGAVTNSTEHHSPPDLPAKATAAVRLAGNRVLTAGPGHAGRIWDATSKRELAVLAGHAAPVTAVAVSDDGKRLATGSADGLIKLWDAGTFHPLNSLHGHTGAVRTIQINPDSARAVTLGDDGSARVWDLRTGKELRGFATHGPVELTPNGQSLVVPFAERTLVRDVLTGLEVVPDRPPERPFPSMLDLLGKLGLAVARSPDGRMIAVARRNGTIALYESATVRPRRILPGHGASCYGMAFTPDGTRLLTAGADHTVLVWGVRMEDLPLAESIKFETRAGKLWTMMTGDRADEAYLAMARFAAEPPAAVKMARLRLQPAESAETNLQTQLADRRGIELLESLKTKEAIELLEELAMGEPKSLRTREARQALERLGGKK